MKRLLKFILLFFLGFSSQTSFCQGTAAHSFKIAKHAPKAIMEPEHMLKKCVIKHYGLPLKNESNLGKFLRKINPFDEGDARDLKHVKHLKLERKIYTMYNKMGKPTEDWGFIVYSKGTILINNKNVDWREAPSVTFWYYDSIGNPIKMETWNYESSNIDKTNKPREITNSEYFFYKDNLLQKKLSTYFSYSNSPSVTSVPQNTVSIYFYDNSGNLIMRKDSSNYDSIANYQTVINKYDKQNNLVFEADTSYLINRKRTDYNISIYKYDSLSRVTSVKTRSLFAGKNNTYITTYYYRGNGKHPKESFYINDNNEHGKFIYDKHGEIKKSKWYDNNKLMGYTKYSNTYYY